MAKSLVIVESPAKAKTINKYLGSEYIVEASIGHIMDLPKNDIGVELVNRTFEPTLIVSPGKEKVVAHLRKLAAKMDSVYLASDPDREGEAIAAHLAMQLGPVMKDKSKLRRVTFNEITQKAVKVAFEHSRDLDENLVDAAGNLFVADRDASVVRKIAVNGTISTVAGSGTAGFTGDGGAAASAQIDGPFDVAVDSAGNLYIADTGNEVVRKVSPEGTMSTVAGTGTRGYLGDGGAARDAW